MGFFDGLGQKLKDTAAGAAQSGTATVFDYFSATAQEALVKVGVAPSGNLTEEEINAGMTGAPPQMAVVPSRNIEVMGTQIPMVALLGAAAIAAYLLMRKR